MHRRLAFACAAALLALAPAAPVIAHDHELPTVELHHRDLFLQTPVLEWYCWQRGIPPFGMYCGKGSFHYPDPFWFHDRAPLDLSIRFNKAMPPDRLWIRGWRWITRYRAIDEEFGRGVRFPVELRPTAGPHGLAWYADIHVPKGHHWYLRVVGRWKNYEGTGIAQGPSQYAIWTFHVKMPPRERRAVGGYAQPDRAL